MRILLSPLTAIVVVAIGAASVGTRAQEAFRFRSGIELVNVTATVTDRNGRFVEGLRKEDFTVYEDGAPQEISHFSNEPVPVSLGILLDASGSMTPDKMSAAQTAIERFINELLGEEDEMFFVRFASSVHLLQHWTSDRQSINRAVRSVASGGSTAMYDAIAESLPMAAAGRNRKKALLVITDGNDTSSRTSLPQLIRQIQESEVLVYALGVDATARRSTGGVIRPPIQLPIPLPIPTPGGRRPPQRLPPVPGGGGGWSSGSDDRVNAGILRQITDDSGGRTEIVRGFNGLDDATARIADELNRQYYLGYARAGEQDGRWHAIRVEVQDRRLTVRARRGYFAS
jgi:Ca-activated chloride channel homolog